MISRIGKYTVQAELGRGGFGQVYKAWDPDVRQSVAIKVLLAEGDPDLLKRFQLEVVTTASLHHKNIVTIYASGEETGTRTWSWSFWRDRPSARSSSSGFLCR